MAVQMVDEDGLSTTLRWMLQGSGLRLAVVSDVAAAAARVATI